MKKVVFSITNVRSKSGKKLSGFGYLAEGNLLCPCISKNNKPFIRIFEDVEKHCRPVNGKKDEFQDYASKPCYDKQFQFAFQTTFFNIFLHHISPENITLLPRLPLNSRVTVYGNKEK